MMKMRDSIRAQARARRIFYIGAAVVILVYILGPIYWVLASSIQAERALWQRPPDFVPVPANWTLDHYRFMFTGEIQETSTVMLQAMYEASGLLVAPAILNSLIVASVTTIINLAVGLPAAHVFARQRFFADKAVFLALIATRLLPSISLVVAMYVLLRTFGLLDTRSALILIYTAITLPFTIWILRAYFSNIPAEFEEAARLDGCSYPRILRRIVVPLAKPGLFAVAILTFMTCYGEFIYATILTTSIDSQTQTVVIAQLARGLSVSRGLVAAAASLAMLPPLLIALVFYRQIIRGLTTRLGL